MVSHPCDGLAEMRTVWNPWAPSQNGSASRRNAKDTVGAGFGKYQAPEVPFNPYRACVGAYCRGSSCNNRSENTVPGMQKGLSRADESALMGPLRGRRKRLWEGRRGRSGFVAGASATRPWAAAAEGAAGAGVTRPFSVHEWMSLPTNSASGPFGCGVFHEPVAPCRAGPGTRLRFFLKVRAWRAARRACL